MRALHITLISLRQLSPGRRLRQVGQEWVLLEESIDRAADRAAQSARLERLNAEETPAWRLAV